MRLVLAELLVWALTKGASDREGAFDWGQVTGDT